ncbi:MAG: efflux RND transporter periplasmic adaptor subunit [Burkholderiales bacterium]|nr:efflux RND transporter periplasmic adaptor subunit [Burkholderiales bacterium]PZN05614.1 MAG: efflux transporter periplasmic adaptor subunit [Pseudomonadota bacterium]
MYRTRSVSFVRTGFAVLWLSLALAGCGKDESAAQAQGGPPAIPVTAKRMELRQVPMAFEAVGTAEGSREVEVRARVSGILEKRVYNEGEPVKAGAVLFRIEREPFEIALAQAEAALGEAQAREEQAKREVERLKTLVDQGAIGRKEYDDAVSALKLATAAIAGAKARVEEAKLNLSYTTVTAPIGGITGRAVRSEGTLVQAGTESSLLTTVVQMDPVWIRFSLPEADFERLRGNAKGAVVRLLNRDGSIAADNGKLNFTASTIDRQMGTVQLRAEFPNKDLRWLPGQFTRVQVLAGSQQAFLVPQQAVMQTEQANLVWVVGPDGSVSTRPVQTANWLGSDWVVTGGLQPGELVVVDNLMKLRPGAKVQAKVMNGDTAAPEAAANDTGSAQKESTPAAR